MPHNVDLFLKSIFVFKDKNDSLSSEQYSYKNDDYRGSVFRSTNDEGRCYQVPKSLIATNVVELKSNYTFSTYYDANDSSFSYRQFAHLYSGEKCEKAIVLERNVHRITGIYKCKVNDIKFAVCD